MADKKKLTESFRHLMEALKYEKKAQTSPFFAAGIAKCFENCFEHAWKYLKQTVNEQGMEVYSPREAVKEAARLGLIEDLELWLGFIEDRNLSVHNYLGVSDEDYLQTIRDFSTEVKKLLSSKPS